MFRMLAIAMLLSGPAFAQEAEILSVEARRGGDVWTFSVTIRSDDTGWDQYADGWRVEAPDGQVLGTRKLLHPHVEEQPFTRSLGGIAIPEGMDHVNVRASMLPGGWQERTFRLDLPDS